MTVTYAFDPVGRSSWGTDWRLMTGLVLGQYESQVIAPEWVIAQLGTDWRLYDTRTQALEGHRAWVQALDRLYELRQDNTQIQETHTHA